MPVCAGPYYDGFFRYKQSEPTMKTKCIHCHWARTQKSTGNKFCCNTKSVYFGNKIFGGFNPCKRFEPPMNIKDSEVPITPTPTTTITRRIIL